MIFEPKEFTTKTGLKVVIRTPEIEDAEELLCFIKKVCGETNYLLSTPDDMNFSVDGEKAFIESNLKSKNYLLIALVNGKIVGDASLNISNQIKLRHRANIGIAILKDYWNNGIGSVLFEAMIEIAKENENIEQLNLTYAKDNKRGENLYKKFGFVETGVFPKSLKQLDGTYTDEVFMSRYLK